MHARCWPIADIRMNAFSVAFRGKADITFCDAHVRLCPKADMDGSRLLPCKQSRIQFLRDGRIQGPVAGLAEISLVAHHSIFG